MCPSSTTEDGTRGGSRTAATSKMERFVIIVNGWKLEAVNYYHKVLHLGYCSSPRSASGTLQNTNCAGQMQTLLKFTSQILSSVGESIHLDYAKQISKIEDF